MSRPTPIRGFGACDRPASHETVAAPQVVTHVDPAASNPASNPTTADGLVSPARQTGAHAGRVLAGKFRLERLVDSGGMGEVYEALHLDLQTPVAVKVLFPEFAASAEHVERFRREAKSALLLDHPNVVRVLDFGWFDDLLCIVMELLEGRSLARWLIRRPTLPTLAEVREIFGMVLAAFEAAHAQGIVHRDIKPDNILLQQTPAGSIVAKVVDFGLARLREDLDPSGSLTRRHTVAGTPEYMSPEQCRSLQVGPASDVYALGCVLTDLLQGTPPFRGPSKMDVMAKHMFFPAPPIERGTGLEPVPAALEALRREMLEKNPEQRPQSVAEVRRRFEAALEGAAPEAPRVDPGSVELVAEPAATGAPGGDARASEAPPAEAPRTIGVLRLEDRDEGATDLRFLNLATQGFRLLRINADEPRLSPAPDVVVLDAGSEVLAALTWLGFLRAIDPCPAVVVCVAEATLEIMNQLMAAGAATLVAYPVTDAQITERVREALAKRGRTTTGAEPRGAP